jgi:hypothetical protein
VLAWLNNQRFTTRIALAGKFRHCSFLALFRLIPPAKNTRDADREAAAICMKRGLSWRAGASNTMSAARTARLPTGPRTSTPRIGRTGLIGAAPKDCLRGSRYPRSRALCPPQCRCARQFDLGDTVFSSASHEIDVMPWVFGRDVVRVNWFSLGER